MNNFDLDVSAEGSKWEAELFGAEYGAFLSTTNSSSVSIPGKLAQLPPMAEIIWGTVLRVDGRHTEASVLQPELANTLLGAAITKSSTPIDRAEYLWMPVSFFFLRHLGKEFEDGVSVALSRLKVTGLDVETFRYLCHLFFHPLQNIQQHAISGAGSSFAGVATRIIEHPSPEAPSILQYRSALGLNDPSQRFLEAIFHDEGAGIAEHFYSSQTRSLHSQSLEHLHPVLEWSRLNQAFERHATSKDFHRRTTAVDMAPGVGLASLMRSLKTLRAFLEVRTGRYRVYRWFTPADIIPQTSMLHPPIPPEVLARVRGTIIRLFIPIP